jgi:RNA polymerase sigma factor (TIGR02999 family)
VATGKPSFERMGRASGPGALDDLMPVVYEELKRMARGHRRAHEATLSTTELVHEAYLKLANGRAEWEGRAHFFGAASQAMRQVLVDFARRRGAEKRGGDIEIVSLGESDALIEIEIDRMIELDAALDRLNAIDSRLRQIVELRFFGGVPREEIARIMGVSVRTLERDWLKARLVLLEALGERGAKGEG